MEKKIKNFAKLRKEAEERLKQQTERLKSISMQDVKTLAHELATHQIELEMQNEEMRRAQEELEASRSRYVDLYDAAPIGYFTFDKNGVIVEVNLTGAALLGVDRQRLINKPLSAFVIKEDLNIFREYLMETLKIEACLISEIWLKRKDGSVIFVRLQSVAVKDCSAISACCRTAISDITIRKEAEEELRKVYVELDLRVKERTKDLVNVNQQLLLEIEERKKAEGSLLQALNEVKQLKDLLREENLYLREEVDLVHSHKQIVGNSEVVRSVLKQIEQVAGTESTVVIQGETGTGKELVANAIHGMSSRKDRLMIKINCAALPPTLIESELFGREKGAFTGSLSKQLGRFELANASTIFLDEIDSLPLELQAKLLRVLESGEFERLGSSQTMKVDVRIISATNCDLGKAVFDGRFREDLYYRLNVFQIIVPPLRERPEDILPLIWSFVQEFSKRMGKRIESIPQKSVEALQSYPWPGNVRELKNVVERAMIITTGPVLLLDIPKIAQSSANHSETLEGSEKRHIIEALNTTGWKVSGKDGAAKILGINPKTLESRMQKLGIQRNKKNA
ncbi:MAG: sigma 54-interacting transcriptional regulator [Thermodesulfovibrionia bacterium]|nr:sigma 54-interacting transcriptional regulator [Thermodesulfovibrionia bacterium]